MITFSRSPRMEADRTSSQTIPFPQLPLEIREQIYTYSFIPIPNEVPTVHPRHIDFNSEALTTRHSVRYPDFLPHLAHYNEATRIELSLWFLRTAEIGILWPHHCIYLRQFLKTLPDHEGLSAIRRLDFQLFGRHTASVYANGEVKNPFVRLMLDCPGLTEVRMKFEQWYLLKEHVDLTGRRIFGYNGIDRAVEVISVEELIEKFALHDMLELKNLNKLTVEVWPKVLEMSDDKTICAVLDTWACIEGLAQWFRDGFKERGRNVDVRLVEAKSSGLRWAQTQEWD